MRPECHLCDLVITMLQSLGIAYSSEDIEADPGLEEKYGLQIPVLFLPDSGQELLFPFDIDQLRMFLQEKT
jgi:hypothetical protein